MSLWQKTKDGAAKAANATKKATQKAKLKAEISLLNSKIKSAKEHFGIIAYPYLVNDDMNGLKQAFQETRNKVEELQAQVTKKEETIRSLSSKGDDDHGAEPDSSYAYQSHEQTTTQDTTQYQGEHHEEAREHEYTEEQLQNYETGQQQQQQQQEQQEQQQQ